MSEAETIFTRIVRGEIPSHKIYEDEHTYAFLDINPLAPGHTLVIPKKAYVMLDDCPEEVAAALGRTVRRVGAAVAKATGCSGWNVLQNNGQVAGQVVMHVHFHIIPREEGDGLGYRWEPGELKPETAAKLKASIGSSLE